MLFLCLVVVVVVALIVLIIYLNQRKKPLYTEEELVLLDKPVVYNTYVPSEPLISMWTTFKSNPKRFKVSKDENKVITVLDTQSNIKFKLKIYLGLRYDYLYSQVEGFECFTREEFNWICKKVHGYLESRYSDTISKRSKLREDRQRKKYIDLYCK